MPFDNTPLPITSPEIEFLKKIHKLLSGKNRWCQCALAEDRYGKKIISPIGPDAYAFCVIGAARRIDHDYGFEFFSDQKITDLLAFDHPTHLENWNDNAESRAVVLRRISKYIKLLRAQLIETALSNGREKSTIHN